MSTIDKKKYPEVFIENDDLSVKDREMFAEKLRTLPLGSEREFFEKMKQKEEGEFAPSADIIFDEYTNDDELYCIRYYYEEYKISRGVPGRRIREMIYTDTLSDALSSDLFPILGRHVAFLDWLKSQDFKCVNYHGNVILNR